MRILLFAIPIVALCATAMYAQRNEDRESVNVAGKWELTMESPHGTVQFALDIKQDGSKITGAAKRDGQTYPLTGTVQPGQIAFSFEPRPNAMLSLKGVVDEVKMSGDAEAVGSRQHPGELFALPWRAVRRR